MPQKNRISISGPIITYSLGRVDADKLRLMCANALIHVLIQVNEESRKRERERELVRKKTKKQEYQCMRHKPGIQTLRQNTWFVR